jgi:GNAT superfamily N-acetyltransferase
MAAVPAAFTIRPVRAADRAAWEPLWAGYNAFYGRAGATALAPAITHATWQRFFDADEPVRALVAEQGGELRGLAHYLFHRSTTRIEPVCYLQDLFTAPAARGHGVGRALIEGVYAQARAAGARRVYWQTQESNSAGRMLYDKLARHLGFIVYSNDV